MARAESARTIAHAPESMARWPWAEAATDLILVDRRLAVNLRGSLAFLAMAHLWDDWLYLLRPLQSAINMNERLLEKLGDHFIGLWRFRIYGVRRLWCVTLHVNGYYFDTRGKPTISEALKAAIKVVEKAKKKTRKIIR